MSFVAPSLDGPTRGGAAICACGSRMKRGSKSCWSCFVAGKPKVVPACKDCGVTISAASRGRCRPCSAAYLNSNPEYRLNRAEGIRRKFRDPEHRVKMAKVAARNGANYWLEPEHRQEAVERGKRLYRDYLSKPETRERCVAAIRANSWKISEKHLSWCPPQYRDEYRTLQRRWRGAKRARAHIEAKILEDRAIKHPHWQSVIDHMRRFTSVVRLDDGNYHVGLAHLSPGALLERAEAKGYEIPRWAA
jgi:hypothetical protein